MSQSYRDLKAWQKAMDLVTEVYVATQNFPKDEIYGLRNQVRRAAVSVPSNVAEGKGRSDRDFSRFLLQARGSLLELETQILIALNLKYLSGKEAEALLAGTAETGKILNGLLSALKPVSGAGD